MAYSAADLSANELAWAALDKPILSNNALYTTPDSVELVRGTRSGVVGSGDESDTDFPSANLYDGFPSNLTKPDASEQDFTIVFDFSSNPITFDWFGVLNHNLDTLGATIFDVQIADSSNFVTNLATISQTNIATSYTKDRRFTDLVLETGGGTARRYSDVPYLRIGIQIPMSDTPQIGQLVFGRRRQQQFQPELAWDPTNEVSAMDDFVSRSGVINRVTRHKAARNIEGARFRHATSAEQSEILNWWSDIEAGEQPFFYIDEPSTLSDDFYMMFMTPAELRYPFVKGAPTTRDFLLNGVEQGAAFFALE